MERATKINRLVPFVGWMYLASLSCLFMYLDHPGFYSGDHGIVYIQARSLAERSFRSLDIVHNGEAFLGGTYQDEDGFLLRRGSSLTGIYPPLSIALAAAGWKLLGHYGLFLIPFLSLVIAPLVFMRFFPPRPWGILLGSASMATTSALFYGYTLAFHVPATLLGITASLLALTAESQVSRPRRLIWSGLLAGAAVSMRTETYCLVPALLAGIYWQGLAMRDQAWRRRALAFAGGAGLVLVPLWLFNWAVYVHPLGLHVYSNFSGQVDWIGSRREIIKVLSGGLGDPLALAAIAATAALAYVRAAKVPTPARSAITVLLLMPILAYLGRALAVPFWRPKDFDASGLFWSLPQLALLPLAFGPAATRKPESARLASGLLVISSVYVVLVVLTTTTHGDLQWGPRLLLPVLPLLVLAITLPLAERWPFRHPYRMEMLLVGLALAGGLAIQARGLREMDMRERYLGGLRALAAQTVPKGAAVITDLSWAAQVMPEVFFNARMFYVQTPESAVQVVNALLDRGVTNLWRVATPENDGGAIDQAFHNLGLLDRLRILSETEHSYHVLRIVNFKFSGPDP